MSSFRRDAPTAVWKREIRGAVPAGELIADDRVEGRVVNAVDDLTETKQEPRGAVEPAKSKTVPTGAGRMNARSCAAVIR